MPCPEIETWKQFLADALVQPLERTLGEHLRTCPECRAVIERLSDNLELHQWACRAYTLANDPAEGLQLRRVLEEIRPTPGDRLANDTTVEAAAPDWTSVLAPSTYPEDLGRVGPYRVQEQLGHGGMGIVFRAQDPVLQRRVAVKVLRPDLAGPTARRRLIREAQMAARIRHDNLVTVFAVVDPPDSLPYLVMEYLDGPTLSALIQSGCLEPLRAAALLGQVADGLAAAHTAGLIHRDIKPGNIILDQTTGRAKLMDFGLARVTAQASGLTQEHLLAGTPTYMSPEQVHHADALDPRSDVYSLGVTLYEALTGELPFRGTPQMVLRQALHDEPRPPRRLNESVPRDLETICLKAMARDPGRRYQTAQEFSDDLGRWRRGEPIKARPVGQAERCWRWCRRRPVVTSLATALVIVGLLGAAGITWKWREAEDNAAQAKLEAAEARHQKALATAGQQQAEDNLRQAVEVVRQLFVRLTEENLNIAGAQLAQKKMIEDALTYNRRFLEQQKDDAGLQLEVAKCCFRLGEINWTIGKSRDAVTAFEEAVTHYLLLMRRDANPEHPRHRRVATSILAISRETRATWTRRCELTSRHRPSWKS
jgi:tRNA A-37 threonylcarbamoyl transferase component Bud32